MRPFTIITTVLMALSLVMTSCDSVPPQPTKILGAFDVDSVHFDFGDGTQQMLRNENYERLVFTGDSIEWHYNSTNGWIHTGSVVAKYQDQQLIKMGCRTVVSMDSKHMTSLQDSWTITRYFH